MLVEGLVPAVVVGGGVVEFVPADCVAPAGDDAGGLVGLAGVVPGVFEGFVGGHGGQDCCCWLGVWRVGVGRGLRVEVEVLDDERTSTPAIFRGPRQCLTLPAAAPCRLIGVIGVICSSVWRASI